MPDSHILDGRAIAARMKASLQQEMSTWTEKPTLAILSFQNPVSPRYQSAQVAQAESLGIPTVVEACPHDVREDEVERIIKRWNINPRIHGIFVHQPMPSQIDPQRVSTIIDPVKDIEGIHPQNCARRFFAHARIGSCTALAVMELIESTGVDLKGMEAVIVGHSEIVGRPMSMLLLDTLATTTICHAGTSKAGRLEEHVRSAELLIVAVGHPHLIKGDWVREGAIVIDVGINIVDGLVVGDVEFEVAKRRAAYITPVPGGVGPVTVMMVMKNTAEAFKLQRN